MIIKSGDKYELSEALQNFRNLKDYACYEKNEFIGFEYDEKQDPLYKTEDVLSMIRRFTTIKNHKDCYLVKYDVEFDK